MECLTQRRKGGGADAHLCRPWWNVCSCSAAPRLATKHGDVGTCLKRCHNRDAVGFRFGAGTQGWPRSSAQPWATGRNAVGVGNVRRWKVGGAGAGGCGAREVALDSEPVPMARSAVGVGNALEREACEAGEAAHHQRKPGSGLGSKIQLGVSLGNSKNSTWLSPKSML